MVTRGIVFDLDDTLYFERDYARSGFVHLAATTAADEEQATAMVAWLMAAFEAGPRNDIVDRFVAAHPTVAARYRVAELVDVYRSHQPEIMLIPGTEDLLDRLRRRGVRLGLLSDGRVEGQRAKLAALRLQGALDPIVLTAAHKGFRKPSVRGFEWIGRAWDLPCTELAYVADNPSKDFVAPRRLGWRTVRVRDRRQVTYQLVPESNDQRPDIEVAGLAEAIEYLES